MSIKSINRCIKSISILNVAAVCFLFPGKSFPADNPVVRAPEALPGTTVEMNTPLFWISRITDADRVFMTPGQILEFNKKNSVRALAPDHPYTKHIESIEKDGPVFKLLSPLDSGDRFPGSTVKKRLEDNLTKLSKAIFYDRWELPLTEEKKSEIRASVSLETIPDTIRPRPAIVVRRTSARLYPTAEPGYLMRGYLDEFNVTSLDMGMPVAVLHTSQSGEYLYVISPIAWGWVSYLDIAFGSPREIQSFPKVGKFLVALGDRLPLYSDRELTSFAGLMFMGEKITLDRREIDRYRVIMPVRSPDGALTFTKAWIRTDPALSEGFLPYTPRNIITTAFRLIGKPYGWHDSWDERDCGGIMRVIFNCCGITLPRYWSFEELYSDHATFVGKMADAEKTKTLAAMPAGITFAGSTGHISLYLGMVEGKLYSIHQCGWNYTLDGKEYKMARVVVSDYEHVGFNLKSLQFFTPVMP